MQTIGERLEEARKRKGVSIREAAEATKIRGDYLQKFENNHFEIGLSEIYTRGFLRTYSNFLKIPADRLLADLQVQNAVGENKPKITSREVYGRMDLSIASSGGKQGAKEVEPAAHDEDDNGGSKQRTFARIGTSLPTGTFVDQRVIMKGLIGVFIVLFLGLIAWGVYALTDKSEPKADPNKPTITLIALDNVQVKVVLKETKTEIFQGTLVRGEQRVLLKEGALLITAKNGKDLEVEINGVRNKMPFEGYNRCELP